MNQEAASAESPIERAIAACGGPAKTAAALGVTIQVVTNWRARGAVPPQECAGFVRVARAAGAALTHRDLRPDDWHRIWPELVTAEHPAPEAITGPGALTAQAEG